MGMMHLYKRLINPKISVKIICNRKLFLLSGILTGLLSISVSLAQAENDKIFYDITDAIVALGKAISSTNKNANITIQFNETQSAIKNLSVGTDDELREVILPYEAVCEFFLDKKDEARFLIMSGNFKTADKIDILGLKNWLYGENGIYKTEAIKELRVTVQNELGNAIPLGFYGQLRDSRVNQIPDVDPPPPSFPSGKVEETLSEIGKIYEEMGMTEEALNAFLESLHAYGSNLLWQSGERMKERSELWVKVAEINMVNNEPMLAARAYLKAAYCDGSLKETVVEGLNKCFTAQERTKEAKSPDIDIEKMKRIAQLYALINVHPRALEVLKKAEENTGVSMKDEKERILQEWIELMQRLEYLVKLSPDGVATVFGLRVSEIKDWEDVHIPYPTEIFWNNKPLEKMIDTIPEDGNNDNQDKKEKESLQELIKKPTGTQRGQMPSVNAEDDVKKAEKASSYFNAAWICATVGIIILCAAVCLAIIRRKKISS